MADHKKMFKMISLNIAYYRKLADLTQRELAEKINISTAQVSRIEAKNLKDFTSFDTLFDIAEALDIPVYKFFVPKD